MDNVNLNPLYIIFLYILRCLVPLGIMLGISYLLRRFGFIKEPPPPPEDWNNDQNHNDGANGGLAHG
jgi:hypothetical protein